MFGRSIRARLTLWYVAILSVVLIAFGVLVYSILHRSFYQSVDASLYAAARAIADSGIVYESRLRASRLPKIRALMSDPRLLDKYFQIYDRSGVVKRGSPRLRVRMSHIAQRNASRGKPTFETVASGEDGPLRMVTVPVIRGSQVINYVQVATSLSGVEETLNKLLKVLLIAVAMAIGFASWGGYFLAQKALEPVEAINRTARRITAENLSQRLEVGRSGDEISELARTINGMIERLEDSFNRTKQFSASASHELRTPLTILRGETELALRMARTEEEYQRVLAVNLEEIDRMVRIVNNLLTLSRADIGDDKLRIESIELKPLLEEIVQQGQILAQTRDVNVRLGDVEPVTIKGDPTRLRQLLWNLVDNAIKYNRPNGSVLLTLRREAHGVAITVEDSGIGVPSEDLDHVFDRFYRADKARSRDQGGTGLGLSICQWIANAHGGTIEVASKPGHWTRFRVRLPLDGCARDA